MWWVITAAMRLITVCLALLGSATASADVAKAPAPIATMPKVGDVLTQAGNADWPKLSWMYDAPSAKDAAGKIVIHWFCAPKITACADDLARLVTLRDAGRVYIVAYINGTNRDAKKLDPIRESEGVGRGTVAFGPGVGKLVKQLAIGTGPASIVVDVDGKVTMISTSLDATQLDARDAQVNALAGAIKEYTTSKDGPATAKVGEKFNLSIKVQLASWLAYSTSRPAEFDLSAPKDIKCDSKVLKGDQIKIDAHTLTATVSCSAPKGVYEASGSLQFGYDSPSGPGFADVGGTVWKLRIGQCWTRARARASSPARRAASADLQRPAIPVASRPRSAAVARDERPLGREAAVAEHRAARRRCERHRERAQRSGDPERDALLVAADDLRDPARQHGPQHAAAEPVDGRDDQQHRECLGEAEHEVADHGRDEAREPELDLAVPLDEPADQAALQDDPDEPGVREQIAGLPCAPAEARLGEQRDPAREAGEREREQEELEIDRAQPWPLEVLDVGRDVERARAAAGGAGGAGGGSGRRRGRACGGRSRGRSV